MTTYLRHGDWHITFNEREPNRVYIRNGAQPGEVHVKADDEGYVVDIWPDSFDEVAASAAAPYNELGPDNLEES